MIKVENVQPWGFEHAIRGMRNPMNSWEKSDSRYCDEAIPCRSCAFVDPENNGDDGCTIICKAPDCMQYPYVIGAADLDLMRRLFKAGSEHRKYLRQIFVSMDITAPLYWWKEFDTYKVGVTADSCSTMHKIHAKEFTLDDFSCEHLFPIFSTPALKNVIYALNYYRGKYLETKDKGYWLQMIQLLPSSYNQRRTVTMNYENAVNIMKQRQGHKLDEWNDFCKVLMDLPYMRKIKGGVDCE